MNLGRKARSYERRFNRQSLCLAVLTFLAMLLNPGIAKAAEFCEVCKQNKFGTFYAQKNKFFKRDVLICKSCHDAKESCDICEVPVLANTGLRLADKRAFCPDHMKSIVMDEEHARSLFAKAKEDVIDLVRQYPPLPHLNINFHLVTREDFVREYRRTPGIDNPYVVYGLTRTRRDKEEKFNHDIYVVHGLSEETFRSTCAHEYVHAWLHEREKPERQLHKDTEEGLCEWLAYKVASKYGQDREMTRILENTYTRGQVSVLLAAEKEHSFYKLVRWITDGVDSWVDKDKLQRVLVLRDNIKEEEPPPALNWVQTKAPPAYEKLLLKGLSGTGNRRFALINDATLASGEEGKVRLGTSNVVVRCLRIENNTVTVQVRGEATSRTLQLGQK